MKKILEEYGMAIVYFILGAAISGILLTILSVA